METGFYSVWGKGLENVEEEGELRAAASVPCIPQPQTPKEPMEFLSRSWSLSASEISKALAQKQKQFRLDSDLNLLPESFVSPQLAGKVANSNNCRKTRAIGKWFHHHHKDSSHGSWFHHHHKESSHGGVKKKDKIRAENARVHSAVSVAGLATGLAAVAAAGNSNGSASKMSMALASATELLASHCIELAESVGADHDRMASTVRSAVDIHSAGDLMTLTAAAATALRGEAALKSRLPKEARRNSAISPCEKSITEAQFPVSASAFHAQIREQTPPCEGELMQLTPKGVMRGKCISVYINKKSQVIVSLKSKHVGGAFSKKHKCIVYGVCDETMAWPYRKERENPDELYFGLKTAQGLLEFKCKNKVDKQKWVDGIQNLLHQVNYSESTEVSLESLNIVE